MAFKVRANLEPTVHDEKVVFAARDDVMDHVGKISELLDSKNSRYELGEQERRTILSRFIVDEAPVTLNVYKKLL